MNFSIKEWPDLGVKAEISAFVPEGSVAEHHVMLHVEPRGELFAGQRNRLLAAEGRLIAEVLTESSVVMKRYFLSDSSNQAPLMEDAMASSEPSPAAVSYIQQPPLDGSKVAAWIYCVGRDVAVTTVEGFTVAAHNGYRHLWRMGLAENEGTSFIQTDTLLRQYEASLTLFDATLADNCIRTWFFVRDVDTQYTGMVKARMANFFEQGLTSKTHYLASTGIQGLPADQKAIIQLGTYAVTGIAPEQQHYLYALDHLNPTIEYGVTFERGTLVNYGDRAHAIISGTASIDNKGQVMHVGDIVRQTERMWENVEALLAEAQMTMADCAQLIVYLRDVSDYETVRRMFAEKYPAIPTVFTLAPVCRPTWLIEMECIGIAERENGAYRPF